MTQQEKIAIFNKCLTLSEEERQAFFDSGVFNDIVEAYLMKFISNENIKISTEEARYKIKSILDNLNSSDILKK